MKSVESSEMLIAWALVTLLSVLVSGKLARRAGGDGGLFALMALLLGPGAVKLTRVAAPEISNPFMGTVLAIIGLVGGLSTTLFLLCHISLVPFVELFEGMSLELPVATKLVCLLMSCGRSWQGVFAWVALSWPLPAWLFARLRNRLSLDEQNPAASVIEAWSLLLPPCAVTGLLLSGLAFSLLAPLLQLAGYIGG